MAKSGRQMLKAKATNVFQHRKIVHDIDLGESMGNLSGPCVAC